jgi:hypothetical protein
MFGNDGSVKKEALWGWEAGGHWERGGFAGNENGGRK